MSISQRPHEGARSSLLSSPAVVMAQAASLKQLKVLTGVVSRCVHTRRFGSARASRMPLSLSLSLVILFSRSAFACLALIHRTCKDLGASSKEIAAQEKRIESTRTDAGKDEHDVKKQQEVLKEYQDGVKDEVREKPKRSPNSPGEPYRRVGGRAASHL